MRRKRQRLEVTKSLVPAGCACRLFCAIIFLILDDSSSIYFCIFGVLRDNSKRLPGVFLRCFIL